MEKITFIKTVYWRWNDDLRRGEHRTPLQAKLGQEELMVMMEESVKDPTFLPQKRMHWILGDGILGCYVLSLTGRSPKTMTSCSLWGFHLEVPGSLLGCSRPPLAFSVRHLAACGEGRVDIKSLWVTFDLRPEWQGASQGKWGRQVQELWKREV